MKFELKLKNQPITDEELKNDVMRVANIVSPLPLTSKKYNELGKFNSDTVAKRLGKRKWNNVLYILGLEFAQQFHSEKDLFDNIANIWIAKMSQPTRRDMDSHPLSKASSSAYSRKFGSWNNALMHFIKYINEEDSYIDNKICQYSEKASIHHKTKREPSNKLKVQVLMRDGNRCQICGVTCDYGIHKLHFDHIKPWSKGGETTLDNLRVLCKACNEALGASNS